MCGHVRLTKMDTLTHQIFLHGGHDPDGVPTLIVGTEKTALVGGFSAAASATGSMPDSQTGTLSFAGWLLRDGSHAPTPDLSQNHSVAIPYVPTISGG